MQCVIARYAKQNVLRSGWLLGEDQIRGRIALAEVQPGKRARGACSVSAHSIADKPGPRFPSSGMPLLCRRTSLD